MTTRRDFFLGSSLLAATALGAAPAGLAGSATAAETTGTPGDPLGRLLQGRATQAAIWGMPAVNTDLMRQQMLAVTPGKVGQVIYWGRPLDWHNQTLTPNPDTLYFMVFFDLGDGPVVIDVPPAGDDGSLNGNIVNVWQMPLEDAGLLGADKGKGGKFIVVPTGYAAVLPEGAYLLPCETRTGYALIRSNLKSHGEADVARSVAYGRRLRVYPLSESDAPPETVFLDVADTLFDSTIQYDPRFFANLDRIVQAEPWLERDRVMIDVLRALGIEKGKPFAPDAAVDAALAAGIADAQELLEGRYDAGLPAFFEGTHWSAPVFPELPKAASAGFMEPDAYPVDVRGLTYTYGYIGIKRLGTGQFYLINIKDKAGEGYAGDRSYKLTVPPNVPVEQYWSVTVYDRVTHALVRNMTRASRASNAAELQRNADGSVEVWFGPAAQEGKETNWIPTDPARPFELMFRLYAPTKALFDKAWTLPDVERIS